MIAITFALSAESSEFLKRVSNKSQSARNGIVVIRGMIEDRAVEVLHTGVGEKVCRERIGKFLQSQQFDCLLSAGFAGSLNDELQVNDIVLAKNFSAVDLGPALSSLWNVSIHAVNMLTAQTVMDSSEERQKIARESGASVVDMETEFILRACQSHGIPMLSLRVITDAPGEPLPAPAHVLFDIEHQRTPIAALTAFFLMRPNRIPRLMHFARRIAQARKILANALIAVVPSQTMAVGCNSTRRSGEQSRRHPGSGGSSD
jgi:adenosylhomocysteine nucleosidase